MIGTRLRKLRLARNLSLEQLSERMGSIVTKQSLSKYELDKSIPSPVVLASLAKALDTQASYLMTAPTLKVEYLAFRTNGALLDKEDSRIKNRIEEELEGRIKILELLGRADGSEIPVQELEIKSEDDAEDAALIIRDLWQLGLDPIGNITETLENHSICVFDIEADDPFDGISAKVYDQEGRFKTVALVTRNNIDGVRQRLNLAHELGHVVLRLGKGLNSETCAFRFGSAFIAPETQIKNEVGEKRDSIELEELMLLKRRFGLSVQALLHRLFDLQIISPTYYKHWCMLIKILDWKKHEPQDWPFEKSEWLRRHVLRLCSEGALSKAEAERAIGTEFKCEMEESPSKRRAFIKFPMAVRRQILAEQAQAFLESSKGKGPEEVGDGDFIEY